MPRYLTLRFEVTDDSRLDAEMVAMGREAARALLPPGPPLRFDEARIAHESAPQRDESPAAQRPSLLAETT